MLTSNKTRTLRAEFEKTKNAQFLGEYLWEEFGLSKNEKKRNGIDHFLKVKDKTFKKEREKLQDFLDNADLIQELEIIFNQLQFDIIPNLALFEAGWVTFNNKNEKKARPLANLSTHERTAFIMFVVKKCNYDVIFVDNLYVENILAIKPDFFGNAIVKIAGK